MMSVRPSEEYSGDILNAGRTHSLSARTPQT